jgi:hypothetical protein
LKNPPFSFILIPAKVLGFFIYSMYAFRELIEGFHNNGLPQADLSFHLTLFIRQDKSFAGS